MHHLSLFYILCVLVNKSLSTTKSRSILKMPSNCYVLVYDAPQTNLCLWDRNKLPRPQYWTDFLSPLNCFSWKSIHLLSYGSVSSLSTQSVLYFCTLMPLALCWPIGGRGNSSSQVEQQVFLFCSFPHQMIHFATCNNSCNHHPGQDMSLPHRLSLWDTGPPSRVLAAPLWPKTLYCALFGEQIPSYLQRWRTCRKDLQVSKHSAFPDDGAGGLRGGGGEGRWGGSGKLAQFLVLWSRGNHA